MLGPPVLRLRMRERGDSSRSSHRLWHGKRPSLDDHRVGEWQQFQPARQALWRLHPVSPQPDALAVTTSPMMVDNKKEWDPKCDGKGKGNSTKAQTAPTSTAEETAQYGLDASGRRKVTEHVSINRVCGALHGSGAKRQFGSSSSGSFFLRRLNPECLLGRWRLAACEVLPKLSRSTLKSGLFWSVVSVHLTSKVFAWMLFHAAGIRRSRRGACGRRGCGPVHQVGTSMLLQHLSAQKILHGGTCACLSDCVGRGALGTGHLEAARRFLRNCDFLVSRALEDGASATAPLDVGELPSQICKGGLVGKTAKLCSWSWIAVGILVRGEQSGWSAEVTCMKR